MSRDGRTVSEVARELACDWHTVNDTVLSYGRALLDTETCRVGVVTAVGLDETLFYRVGRWRTQAWATSIVDVDSGTLLDMVPGRDSAGVIPWFQAGDPDWRAQVRYGVLSGPYRAVYDTALDHVTQVADPFHRVKLANQKLDDGRRRVQNETLGHRGRSDDPFPQLREPSRVTGSSAAIGGYHPYDVRRFDRRRAYSGSSLAEFWVIGEVLCF